MNVSKLCQCLLLACAAPFPTTPPLTASAQDVVWEHDIGARTMHHWWVSGSGMPIISTGRAVVESIPSQIEALDPNTGKPLWQRSLYNKGTAFKWEMVPFSDRAISPNALVLMDLKTGKDLWQPSDAGFTKVYDYVQVPELGLILVHGASGQGPYSFAALETASAKVRWHRSDILIKPPVYECPDEEKRQCPTNFRGELKRNPELAALQPVLAHEGSMIWFLNDDGPVRVNAETGDVMWRSSFSGSPRIAAQGNGRMRIEGGRLFITDGPKTAAVDLNSGDVLWPKPKEAKKRRGNASWGSFGRSGGVGSQPKEAGPVSVVETTPTATLIYGYATRGDSVKDRFFDLLDASTGTSKWGEPFTEMKDWGRFDGVMVGDTTYFVSGNMRKLSLYEVPASGGLREVGSLEIKGSLDMVEFYDGNILITSEEEMIMVRPKDASVVYRADYPAPEVRMAEVLAAGLVTTLASAGVSKANEAVYKKQMRKGDVRSAAATAQNQHTIEDNLDRKLASQNTEVLSAITRLEDYLFFYLSKKAGGGARALVEVSKKDGKVTRKVPLEGISREMNYELDLPNNRVIIQHKGGVLVKTLPPLAGSGTATTTAQSGSTEPAAAVPTPEKETE